MVGHLEEHYAFYGEYLGVRTARKHIGWYVRDLLKGEEFRQRMNLLEDCGQQIALLGEFFDFQETLGERLQYRGSAPMLAA